MNSLKSFSAFISEKNGTEYTQNLNEESFSVNSGSTQINWTVKPLISASTLIAKKYTFSIKVEHPDSMLYKKSLSDSFVFAVGDTSAEVFSLGNDIEKYTGLSLKDAKEYKETSDDAYIFGLVNLMNNGKDVFFFSNGKRQAGFAKNSQIGVIGAIFEQLTHEVGVHLSRMMLFRHVAKEIAGLSLDNPDYISHDYGGGEYVWPPIGDDGGKYTIDEETFATISGSLVSMLAKDYMNIMKKYSVHINTMQSM